MPIVTDTISAIVAAPDTTAQAITAGPAPADSLVVSSPYYYIPDMTEITVDTVATIAEPPAWTHGLAGQARHTPVDNTTVSLLVCVLLFMALCYSKSRSLIANMLKDLWSVRNRAKDFDERTAGEGAYMLLFATQLCLFEGILMGTAVTPGQQMAWPGVLACTALCGIYYISQLITYNIVGNTFGHGEDCRNWVRGFTSSQALLSFALAVPAIIDVFYPAVAHSMLTVGVIMYLLARITFILKGFRIFYTGFSSLIYFILYLCTLEITPVIFIFTCASKLMRFNML